MEVFQLFIFISIVIFSSFGEKQALSNEIASQASKKIIVSSSGKGDFSTIQDAIDKGVPINNTNWVHIYIQAGSYSGDVTIPQNKPYIFLEGEGNSTTTVQYSTSVNLWNSTFTVEADNFKAKSITFKNTFNHAILNPDDGTMSVKPAVAALIKGDKNSFYNCGFVSVQDTLYDLTGRHYFHSCYIEGLVDFIMGNGQSVYQDCLINVTGGGYITAQNRARADEPTGFVFKSGTVVGTGPTYLGRPWGPYSRVVFYKTTLSNIVAPEGWDAWNYKDEVANIIYAEVDCNGPGSKTSKRVKWEKKLSLEEINSLTGPNYIDSDGWIGGQPLAIDA